MKKTIKLSIVLVSIILLSACSGDHTKLTHFKAFNERFTTVIDTADPETLKTLGDLFFDQEITNDVQGDLDFLYLIDITTDAGSSRYRCTQTGYCQLRTEGAEMQKDMIFLEQYRELYSLAKLTDK